MKNPTRSIRLEKTHKLAIMPNKTHDDDAGYDLFVVEEKWLWPLQGAVLDTGWRVKIPVGCWGSIKSRSSTFIKRRIKVYEGVIDSGYTGPLKIIVQNMSLLPKRVRLGDRLAQLIIIGEIRTEVWETPSLDSEKTTRGPEGFGSSGR